MTAKPTSRRQPAAVSGTVSAPVTPETTKPERGYPELRAHLGLAVLAIIVFNVFQFCNVGGRLYPQTPIHEILTSLDASVPWVFVILAFCTFEPIARATLEGRSASLRPARVIRLIARLVPAIYVTTIVVWLPRQHGLPGDWRDLLEHLTFTQVFDAKRIFYTNGPAWAISVLVTWYLIIALFVRGLRRIAPRLRTLHARLALLGASTVLLAVVSIGWKAWSYWGSHRSTDGSSTTWYGPAANLDNFAAGMALAIVVASGTIRTSSRRGRVAARVLGLAILAFAIAERGHQEWVTVYFSTLCSVGFAGVVAAGVLSPRGAGRPRLVRGFTLLGGISYSTYLWHEPIQLMLAGPLGVIGQRPSLFLPDTLLVLVLSCLAGAAGAALLERPTNRLLEVLRPIHDVEPSLRTEGNDAAVLIFPKQPDNGATRQSSI